MIVEHSGAAPQNGAPLFTQRTPDKTCPGSQPGRVGNGLPLQADAAIERQPLAQYQMVLNVGGQFQILQPKARAIGEFQPPQERAAHVSKINGAVAKDAAIFAAG